MKSLADLEEIRKKAKKDISIRDNKENKKKIVVGMATCGIAAGARPVMNTLVEEISKRDVKDTVVNMTGCIGVCRLEPIVEVYDEKGDRTTYVNMNPDKAKRVIAEHIINGRVCKDLTIGAVEEKK